MLSTGTFIVCLEAIYLEAMFHASSFPFQKQMDKCLGRSVGGEVGVCGGVFLEPFIVSRTLIPCLCNSLNLCYSYGIIGMFRIKLPVNSLNCLLSNNLVKKIPEIMCGVFGFFFLEVLHCVKNDIQKLFEKISGIPLAMKNSMKCQKLNSCQEKPQVSGK